VSREWRRDAAPKGHPSDGSWRREDKTVSELDRFFDDYRTAFVHYDRDKLAELFAFPLHVISATKNAPVISIAGPQDWPHTLEQLFDTYHSLGVADAVPLQLEAVELMGHVASVRVHWELRRGNGDAVYDFAAVYSVVRVAGAWRVAGIIHNELPKLQAAIGQ
jgi:hypothetical protein